MPATTWRRPARRRWRTRGRPHVARRNGRRSAWGHLSFELPDGKGSTSPPGSGIRGRAAPWPAPARARRRSEEGLTPGLATRDAVTVSNPDDTARRGSGARARPPATRPLSAARRSSVGPDIRRAPAARSRPPDRRRPPACAAPTITTAAATGMRGSEHEPIDQGSDISKVSSLATTARTPNRSPDHGGDHQPLGDHQHRRRGWIPARDANVKARPARRPRTRSGVREGNLERG